MNDTSIDLIRENWDPQQRCWKPVDHEMADRITKHLSNAEAGTRMTPSHGYIKKTPRRERLKVRMMMYAYQQIIENLRPGDRVSVWSNGAKVNIMCSYLGGEISIQVSDRRGVARSASPIKTSEELFEILKWEIIEITPLLRILKLMGKQRLDAHSVAVQAWRYHDWEKRSFSKPTYHPVTR